MKTNERIDLIWCTPESDFMISNLARVSNPNADPNANPSTLISYMLRHKHWSPFEMVHLCMEINTTRDIGRQLLRHVSFRFQEFSQRYADATKLGVAWPREARMQDTKNRQNSIVGALPQSVCDWWIDEQLRLQKETLKVYQAALNKGIAKEVARVVLMEGLTTTRMYMVGSARSWMHFCQLRMDPDTQLETRRLAGMCWGVLKWQLPVSCEGLTKAMRAGLTLDPAEVQKLEATITTMEAL